MSKIAEYRIQHWQFVHESATVYYDKTSQIKIATTKLLKLKFILYSLYKTVPSRKAPFLLTFLQKALKNLSQLTILS